MGSRVIYERCPVTVSKPDEVVPVCEKGTRRSRRTLTTDAKLDTAFLHRRSAEAELRGYVGERGWRLREFVELCDDDGTPLKQDAVDDHVHREAGRANVGVSGAHRLRHVLLAVAGRCVERLRE